MQCLSEQFPDRYAKIRCAPSVASQIMGEFGRRVLESKAWSVMVTETTKKDENKAVVSGISVLVSGTYSSLPSYTVNTAA